MTTIPDTAETVVRASHVPGPRQGHWTYADYAALPDDGNHYEIIDGVLYMAPAPIPEHENIAALSIAALVIEVEYTDLGRVFGSPDIDVGTHVVRPDAVVVLNTNAGAVEETKLVGSPDLVVEISSPSTAAYDRDATKGKMHAYAHIGVPEYWIADPVTRSIEVFTLEEGNYISLGTFRGDALVPSRVIPTLEIPARRLFPR
jgi:Uma2 family endonuclease